jgi:CheY-like chemotaxis protein
MAQSTPIIRRDARLRRCDARRVFAALPAQQQALLWQYWVQGRTCLEIASVTDVPVAAVRQRIGEARTALRAALQAAMGGGAPDDVGAFASRPTSAPAVPHHGTGTGMQFAWRLIAGIRDEDGSGLWRYLHEAAMDNGCVLVVDDDDAVREAIVLSFETLGFEVLAAADAPQALRWLGDAGRSIDLLFTDIRMPGMDGQRLADEARRLRPDLKVIFTSAYAEQRALTGPFISKPFRRSALSDIVHRTLNG